MTSKVVNPNTIKYEDVLNPLKVWRPENINK
jgi:hypothetical protein